MVYFRSGMNVKLFFNKMHASHILYSTFSSFNTLQYKIQQNYSNLPFAFLPFVCRSCSRRCMDRFWCRKRRLDLEYARETHRIYLYKLFLCIPLSLIVKENYTDTAYSLQRHEFSFVRSSCFFDRKVKIYEINRKHLQNGVANF